MRRTATLEHATGRRKRTFVIGMALGVAALVVGCVSVPHSVGSSTSAQLFPMSPFDQSVSSRPVSPVSAGLVASLVSQYQTHYGSIGVNRMPVLAVSGTQPPVNVSVKTGCWNFVPSTGLVPIPAGAYNTNTSDDAMIVYQPATGRDWELWRTSVDAKGNWSACWGGGLTTTNSNGVFPYPFGQSASGISHLATTITEADVASGQINHAIAMQVVTCNGYVAPADRSDCGLHLGSPPEGTWFRMPATTPTPSGLTPFAQMVFRALKSYGAVVLDRAGAVMIEAEDSRDWAFDGNSGTDPITTSWAGQPEYAVLNGMPWSHLQVISPPRF
ncbi:MAG: hypothetical protein E6G01_10945 [Actinobacteria bacterium]|nr:MAG: hypothetical protein E6G01_10945 [Actinomycetota bacterium]